MNQPTFSDPTSSDSTSQDHIHRFTLNKYFLRRKVFKLFGGAFHIRDEQGNLVLYSKQKSFKLKEDISLYDDEAMTTQLLHITTKSVMDISGSYAVKDVQANEIVGALKRKGLSSTFVRDQWMILGPDGSQIGTIDEDSVVQALVRRFIEIAAVFMPQKFHASIGGQTVAEFGQNFNPFVYRLAIDLTPDTDNKFDPRLALAAAVLLAAIEGKQS